MDNHVSQDVEALIEELKEDYGVEEPLAPEAERLLKNLRPGTLFIEQLRAAEQLGRLDTSHPRVLRALIELSESDWSHSLKKLATEGLQAPVHQELLHRHPNLEEQVPARDTRAAVPAKDERPRQRPEPLPADVVKHLVDLRLEGGYTARRNAAEALGKVTASSRWIDRVLLTASKTDDSPAVKSAAANALKARQDQERPLELPPEADADEEPSREQRQPDRAKPAPFGLSVDIQGDTVHVSWAPPIRERLWLAVICLAGLVPLLWGLESGWSTSAIVWASALAAVSLLGGAAVMSPTRVTAAPDEWVFSRVSVPLRGRTLYIRPVRIDPSTCRRVWVERREHRTQRRRQHRHRITGDGLAEVLVSVALDAAVDALVDRVREPPEERVSVTYALCARTRNGDSKQLLGGVDFDRGAYLEDMLMHLLEG